MIRRVVTSWMAAAWVAGVVMSVLGCADSGNRTSGPGSLPVMPTPVVGQALLGGQVSDTSGNPVAGATVEVAEIGARTVTDGGGRYQIMVPADSTTTVVVSAPGFATTFRESVILASRSTVSDFQALLMTPDRIAAINAAAVPGQESTRGLMAVRLHSMDPNCDVAGARLSVWPPLAATVRYGRPETPTFDEPDATLTAVQAGAGIGLWLAGAMPPGIGVALAVEKAGCRLMTESPSLGGLLFPGQRHVVAQALTEVDLFLGAAQ